MHAICLGARVAHFLCFVSERARQKGARAESEALHRLLFPRLTRALPAQARDLWCVCVTGAGEADFLIIYSY